MLPQLALRLTEALSADDGYESAVTEMLWCRLSLQYHEVSVDTLVRVLRIRRGVSTYFIPLYIRPALFKA